MPYYHEDYYNQFIHRKCVCGGTAEVISDFVQDYEVRCSKCHISTKAYMDPETAIKHWEKGNLSGWRMDLLIDDLNKNLQGEISEIFFGDYSCQPSADFFFFEEAMLCYTDGRIVEIQCDDYDETTGAIVFDDNRVSFSHSAYPFRLCPKDGERIRFLQTVEKESDLITGLKFQWGDRYLLFIARPDGHIVMIKNPKDIFEEPMLDKLNLNEPFKLLFDDQD